VTSNADIKVTPLFDAEHLRNGTRYSQLQRNMCPTQGCHLNGLEWLSEIFNDHEASRGLSAAAELVVDVSLSGFKNYRSCGFCAARKLTAYILVQSFTAVIL